MTFGYCTQLSYIYKFVLNLLLNIILSDKLHRRCNFGYGNCDLSETPSGACETGEYRIISSQTSEELTKKYLNS